MSSQPSEHDLPAPRRFRPGRRATDRWAGSAESLAALEAELVLLREENARLKIASHRESPDVTALLNRTRAVRSATVDHDSASDEVTQLLVEALVIRESLMEICEELERSMVAFQAKLGALAAATAHDELEPPEDEEESERNGSWP